MYAYALLRWLFVVGCSVSLSLICLGGIARGEDTTRITVQTTRVKQVFDGLGVGAILYEGHITSLAARNKNERQEQLYDDMFARVPTRYLQLMIREIHEPENDNLDPWTPTFDDKNFAYCEHTLAIAKAALKRRPEIQLCATLYTPPSWMKTNNDPSGGGEARATLKPGLELELAEYVWAFLAHMQQGGAPVQYLCICNEPDWPHTQSGYFLTADQHAALFKAVAEYLEKMAAKHPDVPRPKLIAPNTLSAPGAAKDYVPRVLKTAARYVDVIGSHDYDPRGDRWGALKKLAGSRPLWVTEWCPRDKDASPGMINSGTQYALEMHETFTGGANVFMAYDWVYPPRDSGEALIHVDWGNDYHLTKCYQVFRQWAEPLTPGMRVVECSLAGARPGGAVQGGAVQGGAVQGGAVQGGPKPTAFLSSDGASLVVHVVNAQDKEAAIALKLSGKFTGTASAARTRTSAEEDVATLGELKKAAGSFSDTLPARSLVTYRFAAAEK